MREEVALKINLPESRVQVNSPFFFPSPDLNRSDAEKTAVLFSLSSRFISQCNYGKIRAPSRTGSGKFRGMNEWPERDFRQWPNYDFF